MNCRCDGRYNDCEHGPTCGQEVTDDRWGPWCIPCNHNRLAHISTAFDHITWQMLFGGG